MSSESNPVSAVIVAGGLGMRLRPLTETIPKVLVPIGGSALIEHLLASIQRASIATVALLLGHHANLIWAYAQSVMGEFQDLTIEAYIEDEPRGTIGGLAQCRVDGDVLVITGDLYTPQNLREIVAYHQGSKSDLTIVTADFVMRCPFAVVDHDDNWQVKTITEKPDVHLNTAIGIYMLGPRARDLIPPTGRFEAVQMRARQLGFAPAGHLERSTHPTIKNRCRDAKSHCP